MQLIILYPKLYKNTWGQNLNGSTDTITSIGITAHLIAGIIYFANKKTGTIIGIFCGMYAVTVFN